MSRLILLRTGSPTPYENETSSKAIRFIWSAWPSMAALAVLSCFIASMTSLESLISDSVMTKLMIRSADACAICISANQCASCSIGSKKCREYVRKATRVPAVMVPQTTSRPPNTSANPMATDPSIRTNGRYNAAWTRLMTDAECISSVRSPNFFRFSASLTNALLVCTPMILSLYVPVILELVFLTIRALDSILCWNFKLTQASTGNTDSTINPRVKSMTSIAIAMPNIIVQPQTRSSIPQARIFESRSQSEVILAINQPTGRKS